MQSLRASVLLAAVLFALMLALAAASPFQDRNTNNRPARAPVDNQRHGSVTGDVRRTPGVGTSVHVQGRGDAWVSKDGNSRVGVDGHYGQVVHGPARGSKDYGANVRFEHRF